jgi:TonB-dependent receptor
LPLATVAFAQQYSAAQQTEFQFDLPKQPLSASLKEFARLSGQQIIFTEDLVGNFANGPLHGRFSARQALERLLQGTDLVAEQTDAGAVMIRRIPRQADAAGPSETNPPYGMAHDDWSEQVVVIGLLPSLQHNLDIKRAAAGQVDAVTAEDIGNFPDGDLAAAIQRVPGVTISRGSSNIGGVPTSTGAATEVTVRGFGPSFNEVLFDGRKVGSGAGRAFDFSSIGAEFVGEIDVLKTPDAALSAGAIGATINIKFPTPFDRPGLVLAGSASGSFSPAEGNATPHVSALFSDTFANGTMGVLLDATYSQDRTRANHVDNQGWEGTRISGAQLADASAANAINAWYTQDYGIYQETTQETRIGGRAVLQWRPSETLLITANDNYSRDTLHALQYGFSVWFNASLMRDIVQNQNGTIVSFTQPNSPTDFQSQVNGSVLQNNDTGLNVKWRPAPGLTLEMDYDHSQAWLNPGGKLASIDADVGYGPSAPGGTNGSSIGIVLPADHTLPYPVTYGPNGDGALFMNNGMVGSHVLPISSPQRFDRIQQFKLQAGWAATDSLEVVAGYQYVGDHDNAQAHDDLNNGQWQAYAGYGPASNNNGGHGAALPQSLFTGSFSTSDFINGFGGAGRLPAQIPRFNAYSVLDYLQGLGNPQAAPVAGYNTGCCTPGYTGVYTLSNVVGSYSQVVENTSAGYLNLAGEWRIGDLPFRLNAGLRAEYTEVETTGIGQQPTSLTVQASDHTAMAVGFGPASVMTAANRYTNLLPNLDLAVHLSDDLELRFDASRTLTRPALNQISPVLSVQSTQRTGALVATGGNPDLLPYVSDNLDLSAAWYYQPNSYVTAGAFSKTVSNFIVAGETQQTLNSVMDPTTGKLGLFSVSTNINGPTANVYGAEFAVQHVFDDSGFGIQANATLVGTDKPYDPRNLSVSGFAVTGLADSANLIAFYDKNGFQIRAAVNWRDKYLDRFGQRQNNSLFGAEPTFVNVSTQIDVSTSYAITREFGVYFSALNLNDATYSTHGRFPEQLLDVVDYGRRLTFGFRFKS